MKWRTEESAENPRTAGSKAADGASGVQHWVLFLPILLGMAALFVPTYLDLLATVWDSPDQGHGPLILVVVVWLFWKERTKILVSAPSKGGDATGMALLVVGLVVYLAGRVLGIMVFDVGSQIVIVAAALLLVGGWPLLKALWFPLLFMAFLVPVPGILLDAATASLKQVVSSLAESILYWAGYPIARSGVVLNIGPYQLLVADACSGMHSMYSLSALGLLYMYLMGYKNKLRNALLALALLPAAFVANLIRVIALVLITFYLGDEAGQGFLHDLAGMLLFVAALTCIFLVDGLLGFIFGRAHRSGRNDTAPTPATQDSI